jgi:hypothetical protein
MEQLLYSFERRTGKMAQFPKQVPDLKYEEAHRCVEKSRYSCLQVVNAFCQIVQKNFSVDRRSNRNGDGCPNENIRWEVQSNKDPCDRTHDAPERHQNCKSAGYEPEAGGQREKHCGMITWETCGVVERYLILAKVDCRLPEPNIDPINRTRPKRKYE